MTKEAEDAPYRFTYDTVTIDGKQVKVYRLGKYAKERLEKALFPRLLSSIEEQLSIVEDALGNDFFIAYFRKKFLEMVRSHARHSGDFTKGAFWYLRNQALKQLLDEKKIVRKSGWFVLGEESQK